MRTNRITETLIQFSTYVPPIDLTFNQYLMLAEKTVLAHTGSAALADDLVDALLAELGERDLDLIFVSHFESDECGGIATVLSAFPSARILCSAVTARQIGGFGLADEGRIRVCDPGETLDLGGGRVLEFVSYPSEMHLWEGLLAFERREGVLFSSDLMMRFGEPEAPVADAEWPELAEVIRPEQVPDPGALEALSNALAALPVKLVAAGHGPVLATAMR